MSMEALAWAMKQPVESCATKLVLVILADRANKEGECWPSIKDVQEVTFLSDRQVRRHIDALATQGYVTVENRGRASNLYRINLTGHPLPVMNGHKRPDKEIDNRSSMSPVPDGLTGHLRPSNRSSMSDTSLLTQKNPKKDSLRTRPQARTRDPDWIQRLSLPAWANLSATHIAELESQAQKLGIDIAAESLACDDWMKANKRSVKAPYATLKNWLDKAAQIKGERVGNSRANSQTGGFKPAANGISSNGGGWAEAIARRGRPA